MKPDAEMLFAVISLGLLLLAFLLFLGSLG